MAKNEKPRSVRDLLGSSFPRIVCLCGSTRFKAFFAGATLRETLEGRIVLSIGSTLASDDEMGLSRDAKQRLDELHLRKINLADEVIVLNVGGYIGESTGNELAYALALGKPVRTLEPMDLEVWVAERSRRLNAEAVKNLERRDGKTTEKAATANRNDGGKRKGASDASDGD